MQTVDFTTLIAVCSDIRAHWLPSRLEKVYQRDRYTIAIALRTLVGRGWLDISWHPQAARMCIGDPPPRLPDTFTFSQQLIHMLGGLALVAVEAIAPWERAVDLQFARRPGESPLYHLYVEIMGKYSNVVLTDTDNLIITVAHQVNEKKSSVRPLLTGQIYEKPPKLTNTIPTLEESLQRWQEQVSLVPGAIKKQLLKNYRGLSPALLESMLHCAGINSNSTNDSLTPDAWQELFKYWQLWLQALTAEKFQPVTTAHGYNVMGWQAVETVNDIQELLNHYYINQLNQQQFSQLRHQLSQKLGNMLAKLGIKKQTFVDRLQQSQKADEYRQQADLLMAYLQSWQPGMAEISLPDFETGEPVNIALQVDKTAVQNAQALYKQHQKLKRARDVVKPLLTEVQGEIDYLQQVEAAIAQVDEYKSSADLQTLEEIHQELIQQKYLDDQEYPRRSSKDATSNFHRYQTPSGLEVLIGRNNSQNDYLSFRVAGDYDLWFHAQEIPGSHVLLRLEPGTVPESTDLQFTANLAAYYSRARQSEQVPIVYTQPKHVYKPKGAKPGIAIYKQERILWGQPQLVKI
ncbi:Rqc2 family fibronectin-binding protein [Calothrix rhizosoleniae]|uniref:Rqc2 family fibronectin-binding protein n=1 Tax=Calothrix rhizosoleniae TaxID=888997 RepID=UPI000B49C0E8|nr:NFACT family protein [Calothrix rhizosoleniae]